MVEKLWKSFAKTKKNSVREQLIVHYLFLVKFVVGKLNTHFPAHVKLDDLYSSGVTGLIKAIERFDLSKKVKFESYAILLIKGAIIDELRKLDWVPRSIYKKASMVEKAQLSLQQKYNRAPTDQEVATHLNLSLSDYEELLVTIKPAILLPLNSKGLDEDELPLSERIADQRVVTGCEAAEKNESLAILEQAISGLPKQEKRVLRLYYYEEMMLKEIGKIMGVSESRVSQIHTKALLALRLELKERK